MNDDAAKIVQRGKALYEQQIRGEVEADNLGKVLVINVETGEYEIDANHLTASTHVANFPGAPALGRLGLHSPVKA